MGNTYEFGMKPIRTVDPDGSGDGKLEGQVTRVSVVHFQESPMSSRMTE